MRIAMADKAAERQVFISYVADDPDWPPEAIEAVASSIRDAGIPVRLDLWKQPAKARFQPIGAWLAWMDDAIIGASHILCLVSPRYQKEWLRKSEESETGLALQAILVISSTNQHGQNGEERILTIRPKGHGFECVPAELVGNVSYEWSADRNRLLSWLSAKQRSILDGRTNAAVGPVETSASLSDGLMRDGLHYPDRTAVDDSAESTQAPATADGATLVLEHVDGIGELSIVLEGHGISIPGVSAPKIEKQKRTVAAQPTRIITSSLGTSDLWPAEDAWRAPIGDFPPPWASAWGDDPYGLWADLTVNGATQRMRWIEPSGEAGFLMGSTKKERAAIKNKNVRNWADQHEHEPRKERVDTGFWLADTPCTQAFWTAVVGDNPSHFGGRPDAAERPVENVTWDVVMEQFIARFVARPEWGTGQRLCLPTELEWEYAARAGTRTAYWWGDQPDDMRANWGRLREGTTPVKDCAPNLWGLYDVHGNVWEWCSNPWQPRRDAPEAQPNEDGRVVRGGSWFARSGDARAAFRGWRRRWDALRGNGFRFALRSPSGPEAR